MGIAFLPNEADTPLVINSDRMLAGAVPFKRLKPIARRYAQIFKGGRAVQHPQLSTSHIGDIRWEAFRHQTLKNRRRALGSKALNHGITYGVMGGVTSSIIRVPFWSAMRNTECEGPFMRVVAKIQGIAPTAWLTSRSRVAAQAISIGIDAAGKGALQDIRAMIRGAGMGQRLGNAVRQNTFPKLPRVSMRAASEISASGNAADIIEAFSEGVTIRGRGRYLAIPTVAVPRGRYNAKLTPRELEMRFLRKLELRIFRGKACLVLVEARTTRAGAARGATRSQIARGRGREVVMFWLQDSVTLPKRLAPRAIANAWARRIPGLIDRAAASLKG